MVMRSILDNVYTSQDGGKTWTKDVLTSRYGVFGDPCVVASPRGDFYYLHLSDPEGAGWASESLLDRIVCQRSTDGGCSWSKGGGMGLSGAKDQDKEWAVVSADNKRIHACWTQFDRYNSREAGDSTLILCSHASKAETNGRLPCASRRGGRLPRWRQHREGAVPAVGTNGEVYVAWALGDGFGSITARMAAVRGAKTARWPPSWEVGTKQSLALDDAMACL